MKIFEISLNKPLPPSKKKGVFAGCLRCTDVTEHILLVILRSQSTLYHQQFTRSGKSCNLIIFRELPVV